MKHTHIDTSIKYYRRKLDLRQSDLAEKLGIKSYLMSFIETKKIYPEPEIAERLAEFLEVPIGKLYLEEELELILRKDK